MLGLACCLVCAPSAGSAQDLDIEMSIGGSFPAGGMAERHRPGPRIAVSVRRDLADGPWSVRGEVARTVLGGSADRDPPAPDMHTVSATVAALLGLGGDRVRPYLLAGAGGYRMQRDEEWRNPYGTVPGVFVGAGAEAEAGGWRVFAETRAEVTLSDYGTSEYTPGLQYPVVIGGSRSIRLPDIPFPGPADPDLAGWSPDRARYITLTSGRGLGAGVVHLSTTGLWSLMTAERFESGEPVFVRPAVWVGITDWLSVHGGFWPQRMPEDLRSPIHQDGQIFGGAELTLPLGRWSISGGAQLTHPRKNEFGRTISESVFYAIGYREMEHWGYSAGAGWRGYPRGGGSGGSWSGEGFLTGGIHRRLIPNLEAVAEGYLGAGYVKVRPGLRTGIAGLSVEASYGCVLTGGGCEGPNLTASYGIGLGGGR